MCTRTATRILADGMVKGRIVECAKHNDASTWPTARRNARAGLRRPRDVPGARTRRSRRDRRRHGKRGSCSAKTYTLRVVSNDNVATFIKELVLEGIEGRRWREGSGLPPYQPGQYLQFEIPAYDDLPLSAIDVSARFADTWRGRRVRRERAQASCSGAITRWRATPARDTQLRFNVRIALPRGTDLPAGAGSTYMHSLKPGDTLRTSGPFGDFLIKPGERASDEMVYVGGGAGMAPLRAHLSHLFETQATTRRVAGFWCGARSTDSSSTAITSKTRRVRHANFASTRRSPTRYPMIAGTRRPG